MLLEMHCTRKVPRLQLNVTKVLRVIVEDFVSNMNCKSFGQQSDADQNNFWFPEDWPG